MRLKKWQRELLSDYERVSGFEVAGKDRIKDDASFWEIWDNAVNWLQRMCDDVSRLANEHYDKRPD